MSRVYRGIRTARTCARITTTVAMARLKDILEPREATATVVYEDGTTNARDQGETTSADTESTSASNDAE